MGRIAYAEERLHNYLISLAKPDEYTVGLILGQSAGQKDYIVHLAKTPPPLGKNVVEESLLSPPTDSEQNTAESHIKSVKDIPESWVADHAKHVTRMLPGGMRVLGTFVVGPEDAINDATNVQKFRSVLVAMHKNLSHNKYLCGNNNEEHLILNLNSITQKYTCKSVETHKTGMLKPADWKFQAKATKWHQLETLVDFDRLFLISADKNPETLKRQLQDILKDVSKIIESSLVVIEGEVRSPNDTLETISKSKKNEKNCKGNEKNNNDKSIQINLYIPCEESNTDADVKITPCSASIRLVGQLVSRTFVHHKANIEEANTAIKQDIIRSLASRLEMHWDSLIEEETGSPEENITLHEPPRRVLIALPDSKVTLSDYLFPGEGPQEALLSLQELLDLEVQESNVQKDIELQADPGEFYAQNEIDVKAVNLGIDTSENRQMKVYVAGLGIAILIVILAIIVHKLY